jgi:hypothetical protein
LKGGEALGEVLSRGLFLNLGETLSLGLILCGASASKISMCPTEMRLYKSAFIYRVLIFLVAGCCDVVVSSTDDLGLTLLNFR